MKTKSVIISALILSMLIFVIGASGCPKTQGTCPTEFNPPCGSTEPGELSPTMVGGPVLYECGCPRGSSDSGEVDRITAGGPYKICLCDES